MAVILSAGGATLDLEALAGLPEGRLVRAEFARGERAACVAATVEHECPDAELLSTLRRWASGHGWLLTIAPVMRRE